VDADRRDLPRRPLEPDAGQPLDPLPVDLEGGERADQRLLEVATVLLDVAPVLVEIEDRVAHELAGAVERGLAAAVGLDELDLGVRRHVQLAGLLGAAAHRDHGRVLEQDHGVRDRSLRDGSRQ
jgi:hypothetical protein